MRFSSVSNTITSKRRCFIWTFCIISMSGHCEGMSHSIRSMGPSNLKSIWCTITKSTIIFVRYTYQWEYWNKPCTETFIRYKLYPWPLPWFGLRVRQTFLYSNVTSGALLFKSISCISTVSLNVTSPISAIISSG